MIENNEYEYGYCSLVKATKRVLDKLEIENSTLTKITSKEREENNLVDKIALREAVINAIVHNDYSYEVPPKIEIFSDRIELTSAGGLVTRMSSDEFYNGYSAPRNKELMRVFKDLKLVEQLDSGMIRILKNYDCSIFTSTPNFIRVVFPFSKVMNNDSKELNEELKESSFRESDGFEDVEIYGEISKSAGKCRNTY